MPDEATAAARVVYRAAHALGNAGLVHAYGHCSVRLDAESFLVSPARPLGLMRPTDPGVRVATSGPLPPEALPEVIVHQQIFRTRPDVGGVARFQSPHVMSLSALGRTPRALHGFGAYFAPQPPLYTNPRLVRDAAGASRLGEQLGRGRAIVMRGNGAVTVGATLEEAVVMAWYLEDAARVELAALSAGMEAIEYTAEEVRDRAIMTGQLIERMWDYLTRGVDA